MAAKLIAETDIIDVTNPPLLLYGQPGVGKTSMGMTGNKPLCIDFDGGAHRSAFRKATLRFDSWEEVVSVQQKGMEGLAPNFGDYQEIILDTAGTMLKYMATSIINQNAKMGTRAGGLSIQGWGVLKTTFDNWIAGVRQLGKQLVFIAHEKEEKDGDEKRLRPDIAGGSYGVVMQAADIVGYVSYRNGNRNVSWEPTDAYFAKNGARLTSGPIPDFGTNPHYLADLLTTAKKNLGHTSEASAAAAKSVAEWTARLDADPPLDQLNAMLPDMKPLPKAVKGQVWALILARTSASGLVFDDAAKVFKPSAPAVAPSPPPAAAPAAPPAPSVDSLRDEIRRHFLRIGTTDKTQKTMLSAYKVKSIEALGEGACRLLIAELAKIADREPGSDEPAEEAA